MIDTDSIPPSAEVQAWAANRSSSKRERLQDLALVLGVVLVSLVAIGTGAFFATIGMIKAGYCG